MTSIGTVGAPTFSFSVLRVCVNHPQGIVCSKKEIFFVFLHMVHIITAVAIIAASANQQEGLPDKLSIF
jgi:hypothetical protein